MSDNKPLMPLATAVWLVDNTALSFPQISQFCQLHELEVQSIADGEDAYRMQGLNPIASGQLTMDEIKRCEVDHSQELQLQNKKSCSSHWSKFHCCTRLRWRLALHSSNNLLGCTWPARVLCSVLDTNGNCSRKKINCSIRRT